MPALTRPSPHRVNEKPLPTFASVLLERGESDFEMSSESNAFNLVTSTDGRDRAVDEAFRFIREHHRGDLRAFFKKIARRREAMQNATTKEERYFLSEILNKR